jgi:hypothetical protein
MPIKFEAKVGILNDKMFQEELNKAFENPVLVS